MVSAVEILKLYKQFEKQNEINRELLGLSKRLLGLIEELIVRVKKLEEDSGDED